MASEGAARARQNAAQAPGSRVSSSNRVPSAEVNGGPPGGDFGGFALVGSGRREVLGHGEQSGPVGAGVHSGGGAAPGLAHQCGEQPLYGEYARRGGGVVDGEAARGAVASAVYGHDPGRGLDGGLVGDAAGPVHGPGDVGALCAEPRTGQREVRRAVLTRPGPSRLRAGAQEAQVRGGRAGQFGRSRGGEPQPFERLRGLSDGW
ncbi:hypothetical protein GCM10020254_74480 [Streptomyces goshikiensis]